MLVRASYMAADCDTRRSFTHPEAHHQHQLHEPLVTTTATSSTTTINTVNNTNNDDNNNTRSTMPDFQIGVQPPKKVQAGAYLYPPVVAKHSVRHSQSTGDVDYFATAVLLDRRGAVVDGYLEGTKAASRYEVAASGSSGSKAASSSFVFPFADLSIAHAGTFTIRIDVYQFLPGDYAGAELVAQLSTRTVSVVAGETATESPSSDERSLMRKARDAGLPLLPA
ncbi:hypothetical protein JDV02_005534 [Purpureocillium takamizusanense]|uniref:Velvet domain-containing protein n=1 Tax=Purpureocillium takamizusanense TaxID=2060973 RepID=A0A9Q8QGQ5_9HYPO|nr:uncharacterized protein JDV02_005534 [Purpureocillium takamizusanense]UNI19345.1 hypothetical protein JDV02_005534 [Purpureocillium takamizusanense]